MYDDSSRHRLLRHRQKLLDLRVSFAEQLREFNSIKHNMDPDERIVRQAELVTALNRLDDRLERVQLNLDAG